jgi:hypothetical protein
MFRRLSTIVSIFLVLSLIPSSAYAVTSYSPHYSVQQTGFGVGGNQSLSSPSYTARATIGDLGVGNFKSSNYQAYAGFNTTADPYIQFVVTAENIPVTTYSGYAGFLNTTSTATATDTFYVRAWLAHGYVITAMSTAPSDGSHIMNSSATAGSSTTGTEQFGMNLEANTSPVTFGAAPIDGVPSIPSCTTLYPAQGPAGQYAIVNKYAYHLGDTVASCNESTTSTIYTASYIFNISGTTPAGSYIFNQVLVATGTY